VGSVILSLHDGDLFLGQTIQSIDQRIDLLIGGVDLALLELLVGGDGSGGQLLVQVQHALSANLGFSALGAGVEVAVAGEALDQPFDVSTSCFRGADFWPLLLRAQGSLFSQRTPAVISYCTTYLGFCHLWGPGGVAVAARRLPGVGQT